MLLVLILAISFAKHSEVMSPFDRNGEQWDARRLIEYTRMDV